MSYLEKFAEISSLAYVGPFMLEKDPLFIAVVDDPDLGRVLSFQGTHDECQVLHDLDIELTYIPGLGEIHKGFADSVFPHSADILALMDGKKCWFVGHSLGGAEAVLAATIPNPDMVLGVITFGCPRLCKDSTLEQHFIENEILVEPFVHANDIVPTVPPWLYKAAAYEKIGTYEHWFLNTEDHRVAGYIAAAKEFDLRHQ